MRVRELRTARVITEELQNHAGESLVTASIDTDPDLTANSDTKVASQKAVKAHVASAVAADTQAGKAINPIALTLPPVAVTASGEIPAQSYIQLNKADAALAMTIAPATPGTFYIISQIDAGTEGHTVTFAGTFDGTNNTATFDAAGETLVLFALTATRFAIIENIGSVGLSSVSE